MPKTKTSTAKVKKIGRDSGSGEFIPVAEAKKHPKTTTVDTIKTAPQKEGKEEGQEGPVIELLPGPPAV